MWGTIATGTNNLSVGGCKDLNPVYFPFEFSSVPSVMLGGNPYNLFYYSYPRTNYTSLGMRCFFAEKNNYNVRAYVIGTLA